MVLTQARLTFGRQQQLLKDGWTTRANFDEVQQKLLSAKAEVDSARAQARTAREQQSYTVLSADVPCWLYLWLAPRQARWSAQGR